MKNIIRIICFLCFLFACDNSYSQGHIPLPDKIEPQKGWTLEDKVNNSDAIIEGKVINQFSQWTVGFEDPRGNVFTSVIIRVSKIFKGEIKDTIIELIKDGGAYPSGAHKGERSGWNTYNWLFPGYEGMFFLRENKSDIQSGKNLQSFFYLGASSTAITYDPIIPEAYCGVEKFTNIEKQLYQPIETFTQKPRKIVGLNSYETQFHNKEHFRPFPMSDKVLTYASLTMADKLVQSDAVLEGEVINTESFIAPTRMVYTSILVKVCVIFKGEIKDSVIEVLSDGGKNPKGGNQLSMWGIPEKGDCGIFFLKANDLIKSGRNIQSYSYLFPHSMIEYSDYLTFYEGKPISGFEKDLYKPIEAITGTPAKVIGLNSFEKALKK